MIILRIIQINNIEYNYNNIKYLLDKINEYDIDSGEMKNYAFISSIKEIIRNINI